MPEQEKPNNILPRETPQEITLIRDRWIPDVEKMIPYVSDEDKKAAFEEDLEEIKSDFADVKDADFSDEEVMKQVKAVYQRSEDLFGEVTLFFEKEGEV